MSATTRRRLDARPARGGDPWLDIMAGRRTIRTGAILAAVACGVFAVVYALDGPLEFVAPNVLACLALLAVAAAPFRDPRAQLMAVVTIALVLLASQLLISESEVLPKGDLVTAISILSCIVVMGGVAAISLLARHPLMADFEARNAQFADAVAQVEAARAVALDAAGAKDCFKLQPHARDPDAAQRDRRVPPDLSPNPGPQPGGEPVRRSRMLQRLGADVLVAADGVEAVRLATAGDVGLILVDLQMPTMDGIAAPREIRGWEGATGRHPTRLLPMTGNAPEDYGEA